MSYSLLIRFSSHIILPNERLFNADMSNLDTNSSQRRGSRRELLLDVSARLFCQQGFAGTSIRDIAKTVEMLPGSIYCHFSSKEDLFLAVYGAGVERVEERVCEAISKEGDPWERLRLACTAHMETILDRSDYAQVVVRVHPSEVPNMSAQLIRLRDDYESLFKDLIGSI